ncbi:MAG: response regulator [Phycisphaerae bacterium]|jgi:response regulator RpfG family c-di-GMP phosphodiesterase
MSERILCVDDEPKVLRGFQRQLYEHFDVVTATGGAEALDIIATNGPFAVVVSDMRMPGMDGIEFLSAARQRAPDSVRIMLTGNADQQTAAQAVNEGHIFRFLNKPCAPEALLGALQAGVVQYRLVTAEKELLEKTLRGAIRVLAEVLSLTNPVAFGHAARVQRLVSRLGRHMHVERPWQSEIAAALSQIGCVTVPPDTLQRAYSGGPLQPQEMQMLDAHPGIASDLIRNIPRLEEVARIVAYQSKCFDGSGVPDDDVRGGHIPLDARILKVASDFDTLRSSGQTAPAALEEMQARAHLYDPAVLEALGALIAEDDPFEIREVALEDVRPRAVLADDVRTPAGCLLISKGQEITPSVRSLLCNYARKQGLEWDMRVRVYVERQVHRPTENA